MLKPPHRTRPRAARRSRAGWEPVVVALALGLVPAGLASSAVAAATPVRAPGQATVWLCRPGLADDPCTSSLERTVLRASGSVGVVDTVLPRNPAFDCFYVYPTVSRESSMNADLKVQPAEIDVAVAQAAPFSRVCRVFAPMYRQVTSAALASYPDLDVPASLGAVAYDSLLSGFEDYMRNFNDGRPIIFIGHSQGAATLINLLAKVVDDNASLRARLVMAILLGGDVEVRPGSLTGGSFSHIPLCSYEREAGCVIAYSSFPSEPPAGALFGRPGQGVALQSDQKAKRDVQVACVNPAALEGGTADLDPYFPTEGTLPTPWVEFPGLYRARCETAPGGVGWLQVTKANPEDRRPTVKESLGPDWGYHADDVNLGLGNLVADVAAAEATFAAHH